ncbi:MAG: GTPase [Leptolyngbya sp. SIO4C1]|nr:GTPase [Leptolyngbya sp. SIO4C1]
MEIMRLVVTGPIGAGKTTFIQSVSEIEVVNTDRSATDDTALLKETTTVALDFGRLQFLPGMAIHLYGTPGQSRFNFMWDLLIQKAHAYILLVPANQPAEFQNAQLIYHFMEERVTLPKLIGITHLDCEDAWSIADIAIALGITEANGYPPMIGLNATEPESVIDTLSNIISQFYNPLR